MGALPDEAPHSCPREQGLSTSKLHIPHLLRLAAAEPSSAICSLALTTTVACCRAQDTLFGAPCLMQHTIHAQKGKAFSNITAVLWTENVMCSALALTTAVACRRAQDTLFGAPCLMRHTIDAQESKGFSNITAVYATPIAPGRCRAIIRNLFKFKNPVPRLFFSKSCSACVLGPLI